MNKEKNTNQKESKLKAKDFLIIGLICGLFHGSIYYLIYSSISGFIGGLIVGLIMGLIVCLSEIHKKIKKKMKETKTCERRKKTINILFYIITIIVYVCIFFFLWEVTVPMTIEWLKEPTGFLVNLKLFAYNSGAIFICIKLLMLDLSNFKRKEKQNE